jgi:hypothetical protein
MMAPHQHQKIVQRPRAIYIYHWLVEDRPYMIVLLFVTWWIPWSITLEYCLIQNDETLFFIQGTHKVIAPVYTWGIFVFYPDVWFHTPKALLVLTSFHQKMLFQLLWIWSKNSNLKNLLRRSENMILVKNFKMFGQHDCHLWSTWINLWLLLGAKSIPQLKVEKTINAKNWLFVKAYKETKGHF